MPDKQRPTTNGTCSLASAAPLNCICKGPPPRLSSVHPLQLHRPVDCARCDLPCLHGTMKGHLDGAECPYCDDMYDTANRDEQPVLPLCCLAPMHRKCLQRWANMKMKECTRCHRDPDDDGLYDDSPFGCEDAASGIHLKYKARGLVNCPSCRKKTIRPLLIAGMIPSPSHIRMISRLADKQQSASSSSSSSPSSSPLSSSHQKTTTAGNAKRRSSAPPV